MWLMILASVILFLSAIQSAYYAVCLPMESFERPMLFQRHETMLIVSQIVFLAGGFTTLFFSVHWWGFVGVGAYWVLVVFLLMPIIAHLIR